MSHLIIAASVIQYAQEIGLWDVLPCAFYELYMWYPPDFANRMTSSGADTPLTVHAEKLTRANLERFIYGKQKLESQLHKSIATLTNAVNNWKCTAPPETPTLECSAGVSSWWTGLNTRLVRATVLTPRDPVFCLFREEDTIRTRPGICTDCQSRVCGALQREYLKLWQDIPRYFNLVN